MWNVLFLMQHEAVDPGWMIPWWVCAIVGGILVSAIAALFGALMYQIRAKDRSVKGVVIEKNKELDKKTTLIADATKSLADLHIQMARQLDEKDDRIDALQKDILARVDKDIEYYKNRHRIREDG